jgi:hypothetical protein
MRIGEIRQAASSPVAPTGAEDQPKPSESRALVAIAPAAKTGPIVGNYRQAPFLAHLLAVKDQHAQMRERRRAEPDEAIAAYRVTAELLDS